MRYKSHDVELEFERAHPHVIALAWYFDWWCMRTFKLDTFVTDVGRSQAEYDMIYDAKIAEGMFFIGQDGEKHYSGPRPHLEDVLHGILCHAVDYRVSNGELTLGQMQRGRDHMNANWQRRDGKPTMLIHDVGRGLHCHLQAEV